MEENLSKWLNGEITDEELKERIGTEEALKYIQIVDEVDQWVPDNSKQLFNPTEITSKPKAIERSIRPWYTYAVAAIVTLAVVSYLWISLIDTTVTYSSQVGEIREIDLPDGVSKVILSSNTELSWDKGAWEDAIAYTEKRLKSKKVERKVKLKGKALFKIEKGAPFSVSSANGKVEVLGTVFEVDDFENGLSVTCFEGKVLSKPKKARKAMTVSRGEALLFYKEKWESKRTISGSEPEWLQNQTKFENAPLSQVISTLEKLFGVEIESGNINIERRFTGTIPNDKLEIALRIVCAPFGITFTQEGDVVILSEGN